jgi:hypothetical protein
MKRPATVGGRPVPRSTGRCALCHTKLGDPRQGSMQLVYTVGRDEKGLPLSGKPSSRFALTCRDREACMARRKANGE